MKPHPQPSGLARGLDFLIAADWTPEQALAVFELLDDLRSRIWDRYGLFIQQQLREERMTRHHSEPADRRTGEPPF